MDPTLFSINPEKSDAPRFEGEWPTPYSYVPFGGEPTSVKHRSSITHV